ncbi:hypothetical protein O0L34_g8678 [Tuta absoluta]|nr:hypothetical protein O0L34_g8678 [Tuta absoluta]
MDQYFARIDTLSTSRELAPRIRFMLRDVVELRRGGWVPRAAITAEGPVPIHQIRCEEEPPRRHNDRDRDRERDPLFRGGRSRPLDDVLAGLSLQANAPLGPAQDKLFGNGFGGRDAFRQRAAPPYYTHQHPHQRNNHYNNRQHQPNQGNKESVRTGNKSRPPASGGALTDVQMRPAANSLLFTATKLSPAPTLQPPTHVHSQYCNHHSII